MDRGLVATLLVTAAASAAGSAFLLVLSFLLVLLVAAGVALLLRLLITGLTRLARLTALASTARLLLPGLLVLGLRLLLAVLGHGLIGLVGLTGLRLRGLLGALLVLAVAALLVLVALLVAGLAAAALRTLALGGARRLAIFGCLSDVLGQGHLLHRLLQEFLYLLEVVLVLLADQRDGHAVAVGTGRTADTVDVVLGVAGHVEVDDHRDVVDVDAAGDDVGGDDDVELAALELEHHLVALGLVEVGVHLAAVDLHALQRGSDLLHLLLGTGEDDDAVEVAGLEDVLEDRHLLRLVADVGLLLDLLGGLAHGELHLDGILEQCLGQVLDLVGHRCREHDGLDVLRQLAGDGEDVLGEAHVEHAVGLVEDEEAHAREIDVAQRHVGDEAAGGGDDHVGTEGEALELLVVAVAVVAAIDGHARHAVEMVGEALHGLVDLLGQLARRRHDDAVDGVGRIAAVGQLGEDGEQVGCRLARAGLGDTQDVAAFEDVGDAAFLYGSARLELHVVQGVEHIIVQI